MRLICFGDSWTAGHGVESDLKYKEDAFPPKFIENLRNQNSWPRWLGEKLNCAYVNMGVCGYGNEYILRSVIDSIDNGFLEENDIIIVMLSYPYRYHDEHDVIKVYNRMENLLKNRKHFYFNSFYPTFKHENFDTGNLPDYFIEPNKSISDYLKDYEIKNDISVWEYNSRMVWNDEKNFWEGDYHPNLLGYKFIGNYIYENIIHKI
jgi:hypothetical protein